MNYFNKTMIFGLLILIINQANFNYCMEGQESVNAEDLLMASIGLGLVDKVQSLIERGIDVNQKATWGEGHTPLSQAIDSYIDREKFALLEEPIAKIRALKIIKLLLNAGAKINESVYQNHTALEYVLSTEKPSIELINLLLGNGADISGFAMLVAEGKANSKEIMHNFLQHHNRVAAAKKNPTHDLLIEAIGSDWPHIVKIIIDKSPDLIEEDDINLAELTSPASVSMLNDAIKLKKVGQENEKVLPN